ncbi:MAG: hypothetical protein AAF754_13635 [Pseudomonadota bacterium]
MSRKSERSHYVLPGFPAKVDIHFNTRTEAVKKLDTNPKILEKIIDQKPVTRATALKHAKALNSVDGSYNLFEEIVDVRDGQPIGNKK